MSALLCRDAAERKRSWDCPTRGAVEEAIGETKWGGQGGRLYVGVEDDMRLQAYGIQMRRSRAMKERQEVWRCASGRLLVINIQRVVPN